MSPVVSALHFETFAPVQNMLDLHQICTFVTNPMFTV
jgi:hypothetical protein